MQVLSHLINRLDRLPVRVDVPRGTGRWSLVHGHQNLKLVNIREELASPPGSFITLLVCSTKIAFDLHKGSEEIIQRENSEYTPGPLVAEIANLPLRVS